MSGEIIRDKYTLDKIINYDYVQEGNIKFTSIILLTYNQLDCTKLCIESIRKFTPKGQYEIIVVDNNSTDGTIEYLKSQEDLIVIYNNYNAGFPKGCNQGIKIAKGDSILLLNNDTIVTPNWLNNLDKVLYSSDDIGVVGPISNSCSNGQAINVIYQNIDEMIDFANLLNMQDSTDKCDLKQYLVGYCYLVKKSVIDKVGLLDERFTPGNFEDNDLSLRILLEGYKLLLCKNVFIHHFGSTSFRSDVQNYINVYYSNKSKFDNKWGSDVLYGSAVRSDLVNLFKKDRNQSINVLEIGCGTGATLLHIKNLYKNANLYGIELSKSLAKIASTYADIINEDVEKAILPYEENSFDYIILGDVLEHLKDPWKLLKDLNLFLKSDGYILASIPNIMHISVIREIINGSFTYQEAGILDKTHLRFFTLNEMYKMFESANLQVEEVHPIQYYTQQLEEEDLIKKLCEITSEENRIQYLSGQYILKARRRG